MTPYNIKSFISRSSVHQSGYVETTLQLELYDMVDVKKRNEYPDEEYAADDPSRNYFEGWMLP